MRVTKEELENILGMVVPNFVADEMKQNPLEYEKLTKEEYEKYIISVLLVLFSDITKSGEYRLQEWEYGWGENFKEFAKTKDVMSLIPRYHGKNKYVRWLGDIVTPTTPQFDYKIHTHFIDTIINHYMNGITNVYEFGCGPGYHLLRLQQRYPNVSFCGLDWTTASQTIIKKINESCDTTIDSHRFDFFKPDRQFEIKENSIVYTIAALEQVGSGFVDFVEYLIEKNPKVCIHMEPMSEFLSEDKLLDVLSVEYFKKRNYLCGFYNYLLKLEKLGRIEILNKKRIYSGSYFIEGHSLVVWKPIKP
jgi:hypothetical protein